MHDGDLVITADGTVVDGLDVRGFVVVRADDVTIRNSVVRGGATGGRIRALVEAWHGTRDLVVEDSTLEGAQPDGWLNGVVGSGFTLRRTDVSRVVDNIVVLGDDVTVEDSRLRDTFHVTPWPFQPDDQTHNDNVQIEGGSRIRITGSVLEGARNAAIMVTQNVSPVRDLVVTGNTLSGGQCTVNLSEKGRGAITSTFSGNRYGSSAITGCSIIAPATSRPATAGDVVAPTGALVTVRRGA